MKGPSFVRSTWRVRLFIRAPTSAMVAGREFREARSGMITPPRLGILIPAAAGIVHTVSLVACVLSRLLERICVR